MPVGFQIVKTRAALFVAWMRALHAGVASPEQVLHALRGDDESIEFRSDAMSLIPGPEVIAAWLTEGWGPAWLVLPVPGDPRGLAGPGPSTAAALLAGEAVVSERAIIVPSVEAFGNSIEGYTTITTWQVFPLATPLVSLPGVGVREADRALRAAMVEAVDVLADLNQSRWSPELAEAVADIRTTRKEGDPFASSLPSPYSPEARELIARAGVIQRIVDLASTGADADLTSMDNDRRRRALAPLAAAVRQALCCGINEADDVDARPATPAVRTNRAGAQQ